MIDECMLNQLYPLRNPGIHIDCGLNKKTGPLAEIGPVYMPVIPGGADRKFAAGFHPGHKNWHK